MADLFATLDDIAEDLRTELDRIDEAVVSESVPDSRDPGARRSTLADDDVPSEQADDAAAILQARWRSADRPDRPGVAGLDAAARVRRRGQRRMVRPPHLQAVPAPCRTRRRDQHRSSGVSVAAAVGRSRARAAIADEASLAERWMRSRSSGDAPSTRRFPTRRAGCVGSIVGFRCWSRRSGPSSTAPRSRLAEPRHRPRPSARVVNQLTRSARDLAEAHGSELSRRSFAHVAWVVLGQDGAGEPLDAAAIAASFTAATLQRMVDLRIIDQSDRKARAAIERWLGGR